MGMIAFSQNMMSKANHLIAAAIILLLLLMQSVESAPAVAANDHHELPTRDHADRKRIHVVEPSDTPPFLQGIEKSATSGFNNLNNEGIHRNYESTRNGIDSVDIGTIAGAAHARWLKKKHHHHSNDNGDTDSNGQDATFAQDEKSRMMKKMMKKKEEHHHHQGGHHHHHKTHQESSFVEEPLSELESLRAAAYDLLDRTLPPTGSAAPTTIRRTFIQKVASDEATDEARDSSAMMMMMMTSLPTLTPLIVPIVDPPSQKLIFNHLLPPPPATNSPSDLPAKVSILSAVDQRSSAPTKLPTPVPATASLLSTASAQALMPAHPGTAIPTITPLLVPIVDPPSHKLIPIRGNNNLPITTGRNNGIESASYSTLAPSASAAPTTTTRTYIKQVTAAPSTEPTSAWPTTTRPTTAKPSSIAPATWQPSSADPTTSRPSTARPSTAAPWTRAPATLAPSTSRPPPTQRVAPSPTAGAPSTSSPSTGAPSTSFPSTAVPTQKATPRSTTFRPSTTAPTRSIEVVWTLTTDTPTSSKPVSTHPPTDPATSKPTASGGVEIAFPPLVLEETNDEQEESLPSDQDRPPPASSGQSNILRACRCLEASGQCLSDPDPLHFGESFLLCVSSRFPFSLSGIESLRIVVVPQAPAGDKAILLSIELVQDVLLPSTGNSTGALRRCERTECVVFVPPLKAEFFLRAQERTMTVTLLRDTEMATTPVTVQGVALFERRHGNRRGLERDLQRLDVTETGTTTASSADSDSLRFPFSTTIELDFGSYHPGGSGDALNGAPPELSAEPGVTNRTESNANGAVTKATQAPSSPKTARWLVITLALTIPFLVGCGGYCFARRLQCCSTTQTTESADAASAPRPQLTAPPKINLPRTPSGPFRPRWQRKPSSALSRRAPDLLRPIEEDIMQEGEGEYYQGMTSPRVSEDGSVVWLT